MMSWLMAILLCLFFTGRVYAAQIWMSAAEPVWRHGLRVGLLTITLIYFVPTRIGGALKARWTYLNYLEELYYRPATPILVRCWRHLKKPISNYRYNLRTCWMVVTAKASTDPPEFTAMMTKLKQHGATVAYIRMDEPSLVQPCVLSAVVLALHRASCRSMILLTRWRSA